ncbi:MAG: hypothetical protein KF744_13030 [Taibaiella sp.]|nr:hypothetical protein [Taibaiella sp.]
MTRRTSLLRSITAICALYASFGTSAQEPGTLIRRTVTLPNFIKIEDYRIKDTLITYACFNKDGDLLDKDTVTTPSSIDYVSVIKKYSDPLHTYTDKDGTKKPIPTEKIFIRYDRLGSNKWMFIDYASHKPITLQESPSDITGTDAKTIIDPVTREETQITYKLFKVVPVK